MAIPPVRNTVIVREFFEEVFNQRNLAAVDRLVAPEHVFHAADRPETKIGRNMLKGLVVLFREVLPDLHVENHGKMIAEGDRVVSRWAANGTLSSKLKAVGVSGDKINLSGISIFRIYDGQIQETRQWMDAIQDEVPLIRPEVRTELLKNPQIQAFLGDVQRDWFVCRICRCC